MLKPNNKVRNVKKPQFNEVVLGIFSLFTLQKLLNAIHVVIEKCLSKKDLLTLKEIVDIFVLSVQLMSSSINILVTSKAILFSLTYHPQLSGNAH